MSDNNNTNTKPLPPWAKINNDDPDVERFLTKFPLSANGVALETGGYVGIIRVAGIPFFGKEYPDANSAESACSHAISDIAHGFRILFDEMVEDKVFDDPERRK